MVCALGYDTYVQRRVIALGFLLFPALSACGVAKPTSDETPAQGVSSSSVPEVFEETRNVSYRGRVEPLGMSIYQQGTHALALGDGRMVILESTLIDLNAFLSADVEVTGALRPTEEAGGIIMRVEQLTALSPLVEPTSSAQASLASSVSSLTSSLTSSSLQQSSSLQAVSSAPSSTISSQLSSSSQESTSSVLSSASPDQTALLQRMAKEDIAAARWTQLYCTEHMGFCVPIHKNWWYVSFGNTSETLWHLEVHPEDFSTKGTGLITVDLVGGDLGSIAKDREVRTEGGKVRGYRSWTQGRHFVIEADLLLQEAVRYMTDHLRPL